MSILKELHAEAAAEKGADCSGRGHMCLGDWYQHRKQSREASSLPLASICLTFFC